MPEHPQLNDVLILLIALLVFVPLSQRLNIGTVLGYLAAGVVIGPSVLQFISNVDAARKVGEFGVVFLLFAIGLELKFERFRLFGPKVFALALAQVVATTVVLALIARLAGLDTVVAVLVGAALALSSTAVVLQLMGERIQMASAFGRTVLAVLLVQDVFVGPLLVFVSVAARGPAGLLPALGLAFVKSVVVIALILLLERTLLRPLLRIAASSAPEVFTGVTLLLVLGTGWLTEEAGLSMALGAFLAGMMVADTEFRHQVAADIQPFRGLFLGLFFIAVGMTLDLRVAVDHAGTVILLVVILMAVKSLVLVLLGLLFGLPRARALALGGLLAQGSEFAFIVLVLAVGHGLLSGADAQILTVAVGASMAVTAAGFAVVRQLVQARAEAPRSALGRLDQEGDELRGHVVVAGFGQVGKAVARHLAGLKVPILVLDLKPQQVTASRSRGLPVFYGNAALAEVQRAAHLDRAEALVVAVPEAEDAEQITSVARATFPGLRIFARVPDASWVQRLRKSGANAVVIDGLTTAIELAERVVLVYEPPPAPLKPEVSRNPAPTPDDQPRER